MITIHIDTTTDGHTLAHCYEGVEDNIVLINPSKDEVRKALEEHPNDTIMGLGHGSPNGLFGADWGMAIDGSMADLLRGREMIGIWCYAKEFGKRLGLKGFFTSMFISNPDEASFFRMKPVEEEVTQMEDTYFADKVCELIKKGTPLEEWVDILREASHKGLDFVNFNYEGLEYLSGGDGAARATS